jgi:hypothetical protein
MVEQLGVEKQKISVGHARVRGLKKLSAPVEARRPAVGGTS